MDFIAEIVKRKKETASPMESVTKILNELTSYEKLAKNEKFRDIHHPITKKKCPTLLQIHETNGFERHLWYQLKPLLITFLREDAHILPTLVEENTSENKYERILSNAYGCVLYSRHLSELHRPPKEYIALTHTVGGVNRCLFLTPVKENIDVYIGDYEESESEEKEHIEIKPIQVSQKGVTLTLQSFSLLGNNDYVFGTIDEKPMRIRNQRLIVDNQVIPTKLNMMFMNDEEVIANYLLEHYLTWKEGVVDETINENT